MNLWAITNFPSLCVENISILLIWKNGYIDLLKNSLLLSAHTLFALRFDSSKFFLKALVIVISFLSFKGITHAHLL